MNKYTETMKKWRHKNPDKVKANRIKTRNKLRIDVITHYGNQCACCGEKEFQFLCLDHINGGGRKERMAIHPKCSSQTFYTWIRKNNYPQGYQILCYNCNCTKSYYGICPHKINNI
jgi:hypothetical protein